MVLNFSRAAKADPAQLLALFFLLLSLTMNMGDGRSRADLSSGWRGCVCPVQEALKGG